MSAYVIDRDHLSYIIWSARELARRNRGPIYWNGDEGVLRYGDASAVECGQMLWDENIASVQARYPDCVENPENMPGPIGEDFQFRASDLAYAWPWDAIQLLRSLDCYEYQACEHEGWAESDAKRFCDCIRTHALRNLPGYDDKAWGAPKRSDFVAAVMESREESTPARPSSGFMPGDRVRFVRGRHSGKEGVVVGMVDAERPIVDTGKRVIAKEYGITPANLERIEA